MVRCTVWLAVLVLLRLHHEMAAKLPTRRSDRSGFTHTPRTTEYSAACCRSTHVLGGKCNRISVGIVLSQLALWEPSFLHLVYRQRFGLAAKLPTRRSVRSDRSDFAHTPRTGLLLSFH